MDAARDRVQEVIPIHTKRIRLGMLIWLTSILDVHDSKDAAVVADLARNGRAGRSRPHDGGGSDERMGRASDPRLAMPAREVRN
ncbi:MAG: hypothetical protein KatS3mg104_0213 [Phycisphaerae bacterium]|jgi:hypothetical protein|nr:MAG: hypothetical protein KatS3mg104_0213 [Phycisphaerae bacterium]